MVRSVLQLDREFQFISSSTHYLSDFIRFALRNWPSTPHHGIKELPLLGLSTLARSMRIQCVDDIF